jgi:hypothetical protein
MLSKVMENFSKIIDTIITPLKFFALVVLISVPLLFILARSSSAADKAFLTRAIIVLLYLVVVLVALTLFSRQAYAGKKSSALDQSFARGLGEDLFTALDGYLGNLEESTRLEAYEQLRSVVGSAPYADTKASKEFCNTLVDTILRRANVRSDIHRQIGLAEQKVNQESQ